MSRYPIGPCACCGRERELKARGLCHSCYVMRQRSGRLAEFPVTRERWSLPEMLGEHRILSGRGLDPEQIAAKLGYASAKSMAAMVKRAKVKARAR